METFSVLLALCEGQSPITSGLPSYIRPVSRNFDDFFDLRLNKRWANNRDIGDMRHHRAHSDVTVISRMVNTNWFSYKNIHWIQIKITLTNADILPPVILKTKFNEIGIKLL